MGKVKDITGQRFGRLVVISDTGKRYKNGITLWLCKCDCGNEIIVGKNSLMQGYQISCGCKLRENGIKLAEAGMAFDKKHNFKDGTKLNLITNDITYKSNTSGTRGVHFDKKRQVWVAKLMLRGEYVMIEHFINKQDAINARKEAEEKYFKPILEKYGKTQ